VIRSPYKGRFSYFYKSTIVLFSITWGCDLFGANLSWANLEGADLYQANLNYATLSYANLSEAFLWGVVVV